MCWLSKGDSIATVYCMYILAAIKLTTKLAMLNRFRIDMWFSQYFLSSGVGSLTIQTGKQQPFNLGEEQ